MKTWLAVVAAIVLGLISGVILGFFQTADPGEDYRNLLAAVDADRHLVTQGPFGDAPRVVVEGGADYDFGVMDRGETRRHTFRIRNNGPKPLELDVLRSTCKCTIAESPTGPIPPGGVGRVTLEWTARTYESAFQQSATIHTSDPATPVVVLSIQGRVMRSVQATPLEINLGDVPQGESRQSTFTIHGFRDSQLEVVDFEWDNKEIEEFFEVRVHPGDAADRITYPDAKAAIICELVLKPGLEMGPFQQLLRLTTNSATATLVELPIQGRIVSDIMVVGKGYGERSGMLQLGLVSATSGATRRLRILVKGPFRQDVTLSKGPIDPADALDVQIGQPTELNRGAVRMFPVDVIVRPGTPVVSRLAGRAERPGRIVIETSHPTVPWIEIQVSFAVSS
jgi:hypothetical protein